MPRYQGVKGSIWISGGDSARTWGEVRWAWRVDGRQELVLQTKVEPQDGSEEGPHPGGQRPSGLTVAGAGMKESRERTYLPPFPDSVSGVPSSA